MQQARPRTSSPSVEGTTLALLALAGLAWWLTVLLDAEMRAGMDAGATMAPMALVPFVVAWSIMMAAMMLPAVVPVVRLYQRAAASGRVAPTGFFVAAYLVVWTLSGVPAFLLWERLSMPLVAGEVGAVRLAGGVIAFAGIYQVTPLKTACLRHCRSPMGYFMRLSGSLDRPSGAFRAGLQHAAYCFGCCIALMTVLVAAAAMSLWWALFIATLVFVERNLRWGTRAAVAVGVVLAALGTAIVVDPSLSSYLI